MTRDPLGWSPVHDPLPHPEPDSRSSSLRATALASAVALILALPLAVVAAGPSGLAGALDPAAERSEGAPRDGASTGPSDDAQGEGGGSEAGGRPGAGEPPAPGPGPAESGGDRQGPGPGAGNGAPAGAFCGPELVSPEGVEAQTCVVTEGADTWARAYVRNPTGEPLSGELTVHRPDGQTVAVPCDVDAATEPGLCETPREPTVAGPAQPPEEAPGAGEDGAVEDGGADGPVGGAGETGAADASEDPDRAAEPSGEAARPGDFPGSGGSQNGARLTGDPERPDRARDELYAAVVELVGPEDGRTLLRVGSGRSQRLTPHAQGPGRWRRGMHQRPGLVRR